MLVVTPVQLRIARLLLDMTQSDLAAAAAVARATVHRYESGMVVGEGQVRLMLYAVEAAGIVFVPDGTLVDGVALFAGVGMRSQPGPAASRASAATDER